MEEFLQSLDRMLEEIIKRTTPIHDAKSGRDIDFK